MWGWGEKVRTPPTFLPQLNDLVINLKIWFHSIFTEVVIAVLEEDLLATSLVPSPSLLELACFIWPKQICNTWQSSRTLVRFADWGLSNFLSPITDNCKVEKENNYSSYQLSITLLQTITKKATIDDGNRLATSCSNKVTVTQAVRNKLLRACCHKLVNNYLMRACRRYQTCLEVESVGLINLVTSDNNLFHTCQQLHGNKQRKHNLLTSCEIFVRVDLKGWCISDHLSNLRQLNQTTVLAS